jgi:uncharacterized protein with NRDE domain
MCTVVVLHRPAHAWPLLLGANRDEMVARAAEPPGLHWPDRPDVFAGRDRLGDGTWLGINAAGVVAAVLNRTGSLGPSAGKRSRGELPLLALEHATADDAVAALNALDARAWRSFNMVVADVASAYVLRGIGQGAVSRQKLSPDMVHMVTSHGVDDATHQRVARHLPRFRAAEIPEPPGNWASWRDLLRDGSGPAEEQIHVAERGGFGTVSSALLGVRATGAPIWWYAAGDEDYHPLRVTLK